MTRYATDYCEPPLDPPDDEPEILGYCSVCHTFEELCPKCYDTGRSETCVGCCDDPHDP